MPVLQPELTRRQPGLQAEHLAEIVAVAEPAFCGNVDDPQDGSLTNLASTARLNLILEQNARMGYAVGRWQEGMDPFLRPFFVARFRGLWEYWGY